VKGEYSIEIKSLFRLVIIELNIIIQNAGLFFWRLGFFSN